MCPKSPSDGDGAPRALLLLRRREQLGLDAELAEVEPVVGVELHLRAAREGEALLARVLEQVVGELLAERRLVAGELLAVGRGEEDAVVVGHVHARDGDHLVLLHLLRQLVRELHRLDAGLEGAPEGPFHQAAELRLEVAQNAHVRAEGRPKRWSRAGRATPPEEGPIARSPPPPRPPRARRPPPRRACSSTAPPAVRSPTAASAAIRPPPRAHRRAVDREPAAAQQQRERDREGGPDHEGGRLGRRHDRPDHVLRGLRERALPALRGRHRVGHAEQERIAGQRLRAEEPDQPGRRQAGAPPGGGREARPGPRRPGPARARPAAAPPPGATRGGPRAGAGSARRTTATSTTSALPGRPPAVASQTHRASAEAIQPTRGSSGDGHGAGRRRQRSRLRLGVAEEDQSGEQEAAERRPGERRGPLSGCPSGEARRMASRAAEHAEPGRRVEPRRDSGLLVEGHHRQRGVLGPAPAPAEAAARPRGRQAHAPQRGRAPRGRRRRSARRPPGPAPRAARTGPGAAPDRGRARRRSRRRARSAGRGGAIRARAARLPRRRTVAARPWPRSGLVPVQAS